MKYIKGICPYCKKEGNLNTDWWNKCNACVKESPPREEHKRSREKEWTGLPDYEDRVIEKRGKTEITGRDIIQPYVDGHKSQKFMDRYGEGIFKNKRSELDGKGKKVGDTRLYL